MTKAHADSPLVRYLRDPSLLLHDALELARQALDAALQLAPLAAGVAFALLLARLFIARLRERRLAKDARLIAIGVPPEVDPKGALLLWSALHDLLRPRLARLLAGQPQLAWEISATTAGSEFRVWVPGLVPPGLVERALASLPAPLRPDELGSPFADLSTLPGLFSDDDHQDHLHLGYDQ